MLSLQLGQNMSGFSVELVREISELRSVAVIFRHEKSGARLLHLSNDDPNNLFSIAFRTPVSDNSGTPHILEHSVLCGSEKFPVKDPFQELLKGSLQTFMNALTYPDKTVYPVSSQVETDFFNLVDIYCDAVFHPLLSQNTFFQEGWHYDIENENEPVNIKGIVYNEMKGVFSDFSSHVERKTVSHIFPDTGYRYESGGIPENITDLTWEKFRAFHELYYHPSNSYIFLYGNIPSEKTLKFLDENYLCAYDKINVPSQIIKQPLWSKPRRVEIEAPAPKSDDGYATVAVSWIFGDSADAASSLLGQILFQYFLGSESSPLKRALIDSRLGEDLDDITGFTSEFVQSIFSVGLRKTRPEHAEKIKNLVFETLKNEISKGLDEELLEGSIRQIEFRLREISDSGHFPYNLILAERCFRSWLYGGDPLAYLAFEENLSFIRQKKAEGCGFFADKIKELLIDNKHCLVTVVKASSEMGKKLENQTNEQAAILSRNFTETDIKKYHNLTLQLMEEQKKNNTIETLATLPRLAKNDLPSRNIEVPTVKTTISTAPAYMHRIFTSGISYIDIGFDCTTIPFDLLPYLPLYLHWASRCGAAGLSFEAMSKKIAMSTGGIYGSLLCETSAAADAALVFKYFLHGKALTGRIDEMAGIISELLASPDFTNIAQLNDILFEMRNDLNSSIISSGHSFAATNAASLISLSKYLDELLDGITQLRFLDGLVKNFNADNIIEKIKSIHAILINKSRCMVSITADDPESIVPVTKPLIENLASNNTPDVAIPFTKRSIAAHGIEINSSVNFVAKAMHCDCFTPEDLGHFLVLSKNLSTGYLWNKIRVEGGAYGGMAFVSGGHPVFSCASYRDPNLISTLRHFETGLKTIASGVGADAVDQSIIATIGNIDSPRTPHKKGFSETIALICGRTPDFRRRMREAILNSKPGNLAEKAQRLLNTGDSAITIIGSSSAFDKAKNEGLEIIQEPLIPNDHV